MKLISISGDITLDEILLYVQPTQITLLLSQDTYYNNGNLKSLHRLIKIEGCNTKCIIEIINKVSNIILNPLCIALTKEETLYLFTRLSQHDIKDKELIEEIKSYLSNTN
jgi:hypothetical protein